MSNWKTVKDADNLIASIIGSAWYSNLVDPLELCRSWSVFNLLVILETDTPRVAFLRYFKLLTYPSLAQEFCQE